MPSVDAAARAIVFEQPLNERMRTFLRLDFLYQQALHHHNKSDQWGSRAAVHGLLDILAITQRGDVRCDVLKELERQMALLCNSRPRPGVDTARLRTLLNNLAPAARGAARRGRAVLQPLRDSEFLAAIKHRSAIPGGTCEFDLPDYYLWLNQPPTRSAAPTFSALAGDAATAVRRGDRAAVADAPERPQSRREVAPGGVFHVTFDRDTPAAAAAHLRCRPACDIYPEISGSHYRCSVRFLRWHGRRHAARSQTESDVPFQLTTCT